MRFRTLLTVFSVVAMADGILAMIAPGPFVDFIWAHRASRDVNLFVQGWGACLMALSVAAWAGRRLADAAARRWLAVSLCTYNLVVSIAWLLDALSRGWTMLSALSFLTLVPLSAAFGYFAWGTPEAGERAPVRDQKRSYSISTRS